MTSRTWFRMVLSAAGTPNRPDTSEVACPKSYMPIPCATYLGRPRIRVMATISMHK